MNRAGSTATAGAKTTGKRILELLDRRFVFLGILPTFLATTLLIIYPTFLVVKNSLYLDIPAVLRFVGLKQYIRMAVDPRFWVYLKHTVYYSGFSTLISFILG
ncbi:MAG: sugar ABC transporter permease, partial [Deltaproteobacteria bacterium]|nr:sugar ABC transporter permease [Deltaproteobacteria bacterium]